MRRTILFAALAAALPALAKEVPVPTVDVAICLDTSGSMDGLLESAKLRLWAIVNELARAKPTPVLRVALFQYGNNGLTPESGWVRMESPLTTDLDALYAKLTPLSTNGGDEYVARVVREATRGLDWAASSGGLKLILVAGNEAATQDPQFTNAQVFKEAISKGIQVNTIFCGSPTDPVAAGWRDAAALADGQYACIDQQAGAVAMSTPYDKKLAELSGEMNRTYVAYGDRGREGAEKQERADALSSNAAPEAAAQRAQAKSSGLYRNSEWDLVDACDDKDFDLSKVKDEALPEEMRMLDLAGRKAYLEKKTDERRKLQEEVQKLSREREAYVEAERKKQAGKGAQGFDEAVRGAIRAQAERKGMRFGE